MKIFLTGDTHIPIDIGKISYGVWPQSKDLTREDLLIVLGDFGLIWDNDPSEEEKYWAEVLSSKPYTILFLDGNHENHWRLSLLPRVNLFGSEVGKVSDNIFHLRRGEVYTIAGKKFFVFGGALSIDKHTRKQGISWWKEEIGSHAEMDRGLDNLCKHEFKVDYILSHTLPQEIADKYLSCIGRSRFSEEKDPTELYLSHICSLTKFDKLYSGHWHDSWNDGKHFTLYEEILRLL